MSHWYVWIDGKYHITRTNIAECKSECGKRLENGMDLVHPSPPAQLLCPTCEAQYKPAPIGGPMNLPHYLEAENARLKARVAELEAGLEQLSAKLGRLKEIA